MKNLLILFVILTSFGTIAQSVGINADGSAANASAMLDVSSTSKGFLPPRMTNFQKVTIADPKPAGLVIWCSDCGTNGEMQTYNGSIWTNMIGGTASNTVISSFNITINSNLWQNSNMDVTTYRDGTVIPNVTDPTAWGSLTTGAWCYYNNDAANASYGKLYNWYAIAGIYDAASLNNPLLRKQFAPTGGHVPNISEWTELTDYLGGVNVAGGQLKTVGTSMWLTPNANATNETGFSAIPGGFRRNATGSSTFGSIGSFAFFWLALESDVSNASYCNLTYNNGTASNGNANKNFGYSVRCIKD